MNLWPYINRIDQTQNTQEKWEEKCHLVLSLGR